MQLSCKNTKINSSLKLSGSKSESNRVLLIRALSGERFTINNLADADDTKVLEEALQHYTNQHVIDVGHAGTSFRFLTAFLASRGSGAWTLTGSERMLQRPIAPLVDALRKMGADISYLGEEGYPPLQINGKILDTDEVSVPGNISSQYLSALLLIGPTLPNGLTLTITEELTSKSYLMMTIAVLRRFGIKVDFSENIVSIKRQSYHPEVYAVEADWSGASYWYSLIALADVGSVIELEGLYADSIQGDSVLATIYQSFGVDTKYEFGKIRIEKITSPKVELLNWNLNNAPDIAQTILCTCAGLGIGANLTGLHTLKIKETDRISAMIKELSRFGIVLNQRNDDEVTLKGNQELKIPVKAIETYHDHRMAMAFAPLALKVPLEIIAPEVVTKSYPNFWKHWEKVLM